jgi:PAS domain S-box-containing protein
MNLNKLFPWLSIRNKLLIAFAGLSILPLSFVGVYSVLTNVRMMREIALGELTQDVQTIREKSENLLDDIYSDLRVLENSSYLGSWMDEPTSLQRSPRSPNLQHVANELLAFARTKGIYYQFRLIGNDGDELLRVQCENPNDSLRTYSILPPSELREHRETYYFLLVGGLANNQVAFAPAELLGRHGERIPVMSFAKPLVRNGRREGILIANVFERRLIETIENRAHIASTRKVVLATGDGHYLYRSDMQKDWNRLLASRGEDNLHRDFPSTVTASILSGTDGTVTEGMKDIISYAPLFRESASAHAVPLTSSFAVPIIVFESESADVILGPVRAYALTYVGFLALFLMSAVALGLVATRQITRPIAELQRGAEVIARGNYGNPLKVETHDEIEKLADQFNVMAASLRTHENEIQRHRTQLEEMVRLRTQELQEEKGKLQAVLDNVPSAFVLLDNAFRIQTVSAAFAAVTGSSVEETGQDGPFSLIGDVHDSVDPPWKTARATGEIQTLVQQREDMNGNSRFLEYIAIPMKEGGTVNAILVIITDITKRKHLEQQLVHAEKLMAAGEMSSIIAHEFRNALTSVKMILQLFVESEKATRTEKKSLAVALDSIYHMETIVTELLNFARPKPVQLVTADLNRIVQESIDFVGPHIRQNDVVLTTSFDRKIKHRPLDESRLKEAIINLLLNAIQAYPGQRPGAPQCTIGIATKQVRLHETMRDFIYPESVSQGRGKEGDSEIILERNAECALIEVRDNGSGIAEEHLRRVFDPFFTTKTNGTGLGLPMVKRTVTDHGGIVKVESGPNEGTIFRIYIPTTNGA